MITWIRKNDFVVLAWVFAACTIAGVILQGRGLYLAAVAVLVVGLVSYVVCFIRIQKWTGK